MASRSRSRPCEKWESARSWWSSRSATRKKTDARIIPGQPEIYLETVDGKGRPLQIEVVKKLATETTATDGVIPAGATRYYAVVYETPILGARQRLSVVVGQTIAADEPATASLTSSKR